MKLKVLVLIMFTIAAVSLFIANDVAFNSGFTIGIWLESLNILKNPLNKQALYNRATLYRQVDDIEAETKDLISITNVDISGIDITSESPDLDFIKGAYFKLGNIYLSNNEKQEAITNYKKYILSISKEQDKDHLFQLSFMDIKDRELEVYKELLQYKNLTF